MRVMSIVPFGLVTVLMLADPMQARAQTTASPGQPSQQNVIPHIKPGTQIWVLTPEGERSGKLESLSQTDVALVSADGQRVVMPWSRVRRIDRPDPVLNGTFFGALIGLGGGLFLAAGTGYFGGGDEATDAGGGMKIALGYAGLGALAGFALDSVLGKRQVIYRGGTTSISVAPLIAGGRGGLRLNVRW